MDILDILKRESEESKQIYLYETKGHWYAYEQSAILICRILKNTVTPKQFIHNTYELVLRFVEMDITQLTNCTITSCSDNELVISYTN